MRRERLRQAEAERQARKAREEQVRAREAVPRAGCTKMGAGHNVSYFQLEKGGSDPDAVQLHLVAADGCMVTFESDDGELLRLVTHHVARLAAAVAEATTARWSRSHHVLSFGGYPFGALQLDAGLDGD